VKSYFLQAFELLVTPSGGAFKVLDGKDCNTEELLNFKKYLGLIRDLKKLIVFADIIAML
jgi:hypothetical protein